MSDSQLLDWRNKNDILFHPITSDYGFYPPQGVFDASWGPLALVSCYKCAGCQTTGALLHSHFRSSTAADFLSKGDYVNRSPGITPKPGIIQVGTSRGGQGRSNWHPKSCFMIHWLSLRFSRHLQICTFFVIKKLFSLYSLALDWYNSRNPS